MHTLRVVVVVAAALVAGCGILGGVEDNWPVVACSPDLEVGTTCIPGDDQRALSLFDGVTTEAGAAAVQMENPVATILNTNCTTVPFVDPDITPVTACVSSEGGITVINPIVIPDGARISFEDSDLDDVASLRLLGPVGIRRDTGTLTVVLRDSNDDVLGFIGLGFFPG